MATRVKVEGLRELSRELKALDPALPKELQKALKRVATDVVVPGARATAAGQTNPRWGHAAINTLRALATQQRAQVAVGSQKVPWAAGHNFGSLQQVKGNSRKGQPGNTKMFPRTKGHRNGDYALYDTIEKRQSQILDTVTEEIDGLLTKTWP